jgi:signal transduction histidine kinase
MAKKDTSTHLQTISPAEGRKIESVVIENVSRQVGEKTRNPVLAALVEQAIREARDNENFYMNEMLEAGDGHYRCEIERTPEGKVEIVIRDRTPERKRELELEEKIIILQRRQFLADYAGMICHEINNKNTMIIGGLQHFIDAHTLEDFEREQLSRVIQQCYLSSKLVRQMMGLTKESDYVLRPVRLHTSVDCVTGIVGIEYCRTGVSIVEKIPADLPKIQANTELLQSIWINLLKNAYEAIKSVKEQGTITISAEPYKEDMVKVSITDDGPGMPEEIRLQWKDTSSKKYSSTKPNGHGYGMMTVKNVIKKHRAGYSVESEPGKTVFSIYLKKAD